MTTARGLAFTAAMRMIDRVHGDTAIYWTASQPAHLARFANGDVLMVGVADLPDGGHTILRDLAGFARRQFHQRVFAFFRDQLRRAACRAHHLRALPGLQ